MSDNKSLIVLKCCEEADCGVPDPGELAFDYVYEAYREGVEYANNREQDPSKTFRALPNYPINELIERTLPYNNYETATIWSQLQLYNNDYFGDKNSDFIKQFQYMLYEVTEEFVKFGERDAALNSRR
tara:strand:- start:2233 stop:2616 length:384 start_codon:yes stop_codon:yes gene_type:complete